MSTIVPRRPVELSLVAEQAVARSARAAGGAVVVAVPPDAPWLSEVLPRNVVRATRPGAADVGMEHLRLTPASPLDRLPTLGSRWPSLAGDAVRTILRVGAPSVDVLLFRAGNGGPAELARSPVLEQLLAYLPQLWGGVLCTPDLVFADPRATVALARAIAPLSRDLFLVHCVDTPPGVDPSRLADALLGADASVCVWDGEPDALAAHGWRSAAAFVAGMISADLTDPGRSLCRRRTPLPPPRRATSDRRPQLTPRVRGAQAPALHDERLLRVEIDGADDVALVRSEASLRRPAPSWPLPALFCAKFVRRSVYEAADRFVFRPVTEQEALALGGAVSLALTPFSQRGLLVGPGGKGAPSVEAGLVRDPAAPGLAVTVAGYLRPWMLRVSMQVRVHTGVGAGIVEA